MAANQWLTERKMLAGFIAGALFLLGTLSGAWMSAAGFVDSARQARRSMESVTRVASLRASFGEFMEGQYGWLGTGDRAFLDERNEAAESLATLSDRLLQRIPEASADRQANARELVDAIRVQVVAMQAIDAPATAAALSQMREGSAHVRSLLGAAQQSEQALYERDIAAARTYRFWVPVTLVVAASSMLAVLGLLLWGIRRHFHERKAAERNLEAANQLLESLLENIPAMVFAKDAKDLRFVRINRRGESLLGMQREHLLGKTDRDLFPPDQAEHFIDKDRETLAQGDVIDIPEEEIDSVSHGRRVLHTFKVPIRDENDRPILLLGISLDITEQKAAERRIVALNEELIRQAQLLQSSNQELESFCYSVSHDLRAPLRAINGYARLLEQDYGSRFDAEGNRFLRTICTACERMARLIDDLLEFSRLGRQTLQLEPVDMTSMVSKVIDDTMEGRDTPPPAIDARPLPPVHGDRGLLHLVWLNLIDNAVKYTTGVDSPQISIDAQVSGGEVVYSVTDNGIGFDMQYADKLFGVFQRLHSDTKYPGTGVGLAIAHRIVARHGGRIWARSEPGCGATFSFAIPANAG
ncbi:MAG TPA: ATP-binding protein [Povalibacter sp.]|uniref:sensor histidine kinase n=1 Tax=Povalibacter sp. TaxID=1962978 RepID=UPI002D00525E|nr:ATP-binding protein [Povalibacter sp.]HMN43733.1 ATP-binding protein [Povalibacter sp.]